MIFERDKHENIKIIFNHQRNNYFTFNVWDDAKTYTGMEKN